jgi:hypothetical protein
MMLAYLLPTILGMFISWIGYMISIKVSYLIGIMIFSTYILLIAIGDGIWHTDSIGRRIAFFIILISLTLWPFLHRWRSDVSIIFSILICIVSLCLSVVMIPKNKITSILLVPIILNGMYLVSRDWNALR